MLTSCGVQPPLARRIGPLVLLPSQITHLSKNVREFFELIISSIESFHFSVTFAVHYKIRIAALFTECPETITKSFFISKCLCTLLNQTPSRRTLWNYRREGDVDAGLHIPGDLAVALPLPSETEELEAAVDCLFSRQHSSCFTSSIYS